MTQIYVQHGPGTKYYLPKAANSHLNPAYRYLRKTWDINGVPDQLTYEYFSGII